MIPSELKGNSKGDTVLGISVEVKGLYHGADPLQGAMAWLSGLPIAPVLAANWSKL